MSNDLDRIIKPGEFPFPLTRGPDESRYLTWVRNHSNYMAARGVLDYLRAIGVLVRGVLINFLIFMPGMLVVSILVAMSSFLEYPPPFILTKTIFALFIAWILAFPILTPYFKIMQYQTSRETGSDSTVQKRDLLERSFGGFLLAIIAVGLLESLPGLLDLFHDLIYLSDFDWANIAAIIGSASAMFGLAPQLLTRLARGAIKSLAMLFLGLLGVLVPLIFILFVADLIVYGPFWDLTIWAALACLLLPVGILFAALLGWWSGTFKKQETRVVLLLLVCSLGLVGVVKVVDDMALQMFLDQKESLDQAISELPKYPVGLSRLTNHIVKKPGRNLVKRVEEFRHEQASENQQRRDFTIYGTSADLHDSFLLSMSGMADNSGLQPLVEDLLTYFRTHHERHQTDSVAWINGFNQLYTRIAVVDGLHSSRSYKQLSTYLITLSQRDIDSISNTGTADLDKWFLQKEFNFSDNIKAKTNLDEFRRVMHEWSEILLAVRNELDRNMALMASMDYQTRIASIVENPGPEVEKLIARLENHRADRIQRQTRFSQRVAEPAEIIALLDSLNSLGHGAAFHPELFVVTDVIRRNYPIPATDLMAALRDFHSSTNLLAGLRDSETGLELARKVSILRTEDINSLSCDNTRYLHEAIFVGKKDFCAEKSCSEQEGGSYEFCLIRQYMHSWRGGLLDVRRELAATASIALLDSPFYAVPAAEQVRVNVFWPKILFAAILAIELWFLFWLTVDVNLTSIHGLYRDRLASAFLVGEDTKGDIDIERDVDLMDICNHAEHSIAPYHLVNAALNLQSSRNLNTRDRQSDFFIFSKKFIGGASTGYCRSSQMEQVFPQMDLATAMAISAAAASPNMGRGTNPLLVALMTLLNIRLGFWLPNPGLLKNWLEKTNGKQLDEDKPAGFTFDRVFREEQSEIENRWAQLPAAADRALAKNKDGLLIPEPTTAHNLFGIAFSGGGIRSATVNLGMTQILHERGVFDHVDYMSTVSGGGYLGSSISTLMRSKPKAGMRHAAGIHQATGDTKPVEEQPPHSFGQIFHWRIRPRALIREMLGKLNETGRWVNVSDGGHIENLAAIELLRRRCRYIIIGDGEADPLHHFHGLATLIRTARIDLGIHVDIDFSKVKKAEDGLCQHHWAIGRIHYPGESEPGYLLYLKSSVTGDEDVVIQQYRNENPNFPHESTADQFFTEGQFEAYRSLGEHIGRTVLDYPEKDNAPPNPTGNENHDNETPQMSYPEVQQWFEMLYAKSKD